MTQISTQNLMGNPGDARSARHSHGGCPGAHEVGAAPRAPCSAAPPPVSTAATAPPVAAAIAPLQPPVTTAVLTIFEGQAVYRVLDRNAGQHPPGMIFRLRQGSREVTGGTR